MRYGKESFALKSAAVSLIAAALLAALPASAQQAFPTRHMRAAVTNGIARKMADLPRTQTLRLSIALPVRNAEQLKLLLAELYDPKSAQHHKWLSVEEFTERFGPTADDYEKVASFAEANGLQVTGRSANRMVINVQGTVENVSRALHVTMGVYQHPTEARTFFAADREPTVDSDVKIWSIAGLDDFSLPRPLLQRATAAGVKLFTTGSGPGGQFLGSDFRAAYYGGTALTGAGQAIGLYGLNYNIRDVEAYYNAVGQTFNPNQVQNYSTDGTQNSCGSGCDDGEPVIDIIAALSMAPGATIIEYFGNSDVDVFNAMASANVAKQLSTSLGWSPADPAADEPIFQEFAAQGQNSFVASGDSGAYSSANVFTYPASDPYVTAVGGTDLTTSGAGGAWSGETAWSGSGGGPTPLGLGIPAYQQLSGVVSSANGGSTRVRNIPDVSAEANTDNYFCANGSCGGGLGGTSFASPRWAGFLALVNEQAANNGQPSVGFLNPTVYGIGTGSRYGNAFHDITSGNNANSNASYSGVPGYDLVTGWGSPNGQGLIDALAGGSSTTSGNWSFCANENGNCIFTGTQTVRYGSGSTFVSQALSWAATCNNATFGDPTPGIVKHCEISNSWTNCANENASCGFGDTETVRFGAGTSYFAAVFTGGVNCTDGVFGDPDFGTLKHCDKAPTTWTFCSDESGQCNFTGAKTLLYGANGNYITKTLSGPVTCSNSTFGTDPDVGQLKHCYVSGLPISGE